MADNTMAVGGVNSASHHTQSTVNEQDFAQVKPVKVKPAQSAPQKAKSFNEMTPAEQEERKQKLQTQQEQQSLFQPGTVTEETVSQITKAVNDYLKQNDCNLELNYNKEANMINVKVVNKETGEVVREYPSEEMMDHLVNAEKTAENNQMRGMLVNRTI